MTASAEPGLVGDAEGRDAGERILLEGLADPADGVGPGEQAVVVRRHQHVGAAESAQPLDARRTASTSRRSHDHTSTRAGRYPPAGQAMRSKTVSLFIAGLTPARR